MFRTQENRLYFDHKDPVIFPYQIKKTLLLDSVIIVLIEVPPKKIFHNNVFAFNTQGEFLWQISKTTLFYTGERCPYIDVIYTDRLILFNWCDTALAVELYTGEIIDKWNSK
ncbi:hypothetical protein LJ707_09070 [Mucilaginibacter sp. UR6-1]|uniref:hypothetical protein n=1 Tax=Mucilaginibacter sp. UR6-1 TaxID=1435643 RepID=UPI001E35F2E6|nr:hypothetical protein [Mucilaginibacter sp. UR6-1]MCC8409080.1 hypothetical protein [Mucilaginibacter sp. UR6-1]